MSDHGNWGDSADDDGSELIRTLSRLVPFSDVEVSSESEESEESTDEALDTVSEKSYHSDGKAEKSYHSDGKTVPTYLAAAKKNLPEEENVEKVSYRPSYLSDFEKEHFHRENVMPDRPYTAFFTAPSSAFTTKDIFDALLTDGIPASAVRCLQRSPNGNVLITFASKRYRDLFLRRSSFVVRRGRFVTHPGSRRLLFVTIYDAPHELPDSAIEHRLAKYGRIFSSRRGKVSGYPDVFNGLRHLRMDIVSHIPCFLRFGKYQIRVKYDGQPTTCRRCNARDHLFKDCKNEICFNCDSIGHHARMCPEDMRCCICKEEGHLAIDCQHSWYRRPPPSLGLSPETVADDPVADPTADTVARVLWSLLLLLPWILSLGVLVLLLPRKNPLPTLLTPRTHVLHNLILPILKASLLVLLTWFHKSLFFLEINLLRHLKLLSLRHRLLLTSSFLLFLIVLLAGYLLHLKTQCLLSLTAPLLKWRCLMCPKTLCLQFLTAPLLR